MFDTKTLPAPFYGFEKAPKLNFKSALCQTELQPDSHYLTVFLANDKIYQYTRLIMRVKAAQRELNAALKPLFAHKPNVCLIHDVLIIARKTFSEHNLAFERL